MNTKATTVRKTFSRETTISAVINASPEKIWSVLTSASDYPRWNTTVVKIDGDIVKGGKIKLVSSLDPKRTFKLKIKEFLEAEKLVWGDPMGRRTFMLRPTDSGSTQFTMSEKIGGPIFPLFASKIPSFDESFETFINDLAKEVEAK